MGAFSLRIAAALLLCVGSLPAQPVFEDCSFPGVQIEPDPVEDIIVVPSILPIADVHVEMVIMAVPGPDHP